MYGIGTKKKIRLALRYRYSEENDTWHQLRENKHSLYVTSLSQSPKFIYTLMYFSKIHHHVYWLSSSFIYKQITLINLPRPERVQTMDRSPVPVPPSSPHNCSADCDKITRRDSLETAVPWSDVKLRYDFQLLAQLSHSHNPIHSPSSLSHT